MWADRRTDEDASIDREYFLRGLNAQQLAAVTHTGGPLLIVAGPGSGKTAVITRRIAYRIVANDVDPRRVMALTFTNKAAAEMRERLEGMLPDRVSPHIGTFHWMCGALLRKHGERARCGRNFRLLTPRESRHLLYGVIEGFGGPVQARRAAVAAAISAVKNGSEPRRAASDHLIDIKFLTAISAEYAARVAALGALDLDDLQVVTLDILRNEPILRRHCSEAFAEIVVDEYQDTNPVQAEIVRLLAPPGDAVTVVGDEDQAIYGWRGAGEGGIARFHDSFPQARVVALEMTYRSTKRILRAATQVIRHNSNRTDKELRTVHEAGSLPVCYAALDERDEAEWIAAEIRRMGADGEYSPSDVAILYRVNAQARALEDALVRASVPYRVLGGNRFYEQPQIRTAASYLRLALDEGDDDAAAHLIGSIEGIGEARLEALRAVAAEAGGSLVAVLGEQTAGLPQRVRDRLRDLERRIATVRARRADSLRDVVEAAIAATAPTVQAEEPEDPESSLEVLHELRSLSRELGGRRTTLRAFVDILSLTEPADCRSRVTLMSLHSAKGLEFPVVFIPGLEEGLFPHRRTLDRSDTLQEERRLCYVGMTRAQKLLYLSYAHMRFLGGQALAGPPSRFVGEMGRANVRLQASPHAMQRPRLVTVRPGEMVEHDRWGRGRVLAVDGRGKDTMVTIEFNGGGRQRVQLCHAPLRRVEKAEDDVRAG